ncbi:MAG: hypothetical protein HC800_11875, partial [Phormidesmis sp. RL_2_1]|nr:hypothetical protein [Phormidesmis sp. RL_2_1]
QKQTAANHSGWHIPLFFTHAEIIETAPLDVPPFDITVRSLIMPAHNNRFKQEAEAAETTDQWQQPNTQIIPPVLEAGVVQFADKTVRMGQISRFHTAYIPPADPAASVQAIQAAIVRQIPALKNVPGTWRHCLVSFTQDGLPLLGPIPSVHNPEKGSGKKGFMTDQMIDGLHLFSGFTSPFALVPSVAQRYAQYIVNSSEPLIEQMLITRFQRAF